MEERRRADRRHQGSDGRLDGPERRVVERRRGLQRQRRSQRTHARRTLTALPGGGDLESIMVHRVGREFVGLLDAMTPPERRELWDRGLREVLGFFPLPQRPRPERRPLTRGRRR
jgi:hypothetical protein